LVLFMPWRCPACQEQIRHSETEAKPRIGSRYRCHICRLELMFDPMTDKLTVAPLNVVDERPQSSAPKRDE
jgi:hypothetical protein